jgi:hypothetical protein
MSGVKMEIVSETISETWDISNSIKLVAWEGSVALSSRDSFKLLVYTYLPTVLLADESWNRFVKQLKHNDYTYMLKEVISSGTTQLKVSRGFCDTQTWDFCH